MEPAADYNNKFLLRRDDQESSQKNYYNERKGIYYDFCDFYHKNQLLYVFEHLSPREQVISDLVLREIMSPLNVKNLEPAN